MAKNLSIKLLMLGEAGVGKTCLLKRFTENRYTGRYMSTLGLDAKVKTIEISGKPVKLYIYDTAGEERFHCMMTSYYRHVHGIIIVFDVSNRRSYQQVHYWLDEIKKYAKENVRVIMVGNKCEHSGRQVCQQEAVVYAKCLHLPYMETSAKANINVDLLFSKLAVSIYDLRKKAHQLDKPTDLDDQYSVNLQPIALFHNLCC